MVSGRERGQRWERLGRIGTWRRRRLERKVSFIEDDMPGDEDTTSGLLQATIAAMVGAVAKKNTKIGVVIHFVGVVWVKVRPACVAEGMKKGIIGSLVDEAFKRGCVLNDGRGESIDEIGGSGEGVIPILGWDRGSSHKGEASLNDVAMTALDRTILFVSVGAGQTMEDAKVSKMRLEWGRKRGENGGRSDTNKWQRYGRFWSRFDKVVWWNGIVEAVKNGGRHAPCLGICCYSEEHCNGKKNHDDRDQRRRLQGVPKVR
ncbi:hypothetical protein F0562_005799 [Nyssa sinensis]|uniref:Uncharacterized protein n=1 Tax=Nyssa sinensis TaxID=561372 RepID=A0A5J5AKB9_9ASTE|nr:hypothetical protein F0562_005799 [Nyssa sinensis]